MAVSFVAAAQANSGQTTTTPNATVTIPASAQAGDTAIFIVAQNSGVATFTTPTGWTAIRPPDFAGSTMVAALAGKDLVAGDPGSSVTFTSSVGARLPGLLLVYRGTTLASVTATVSAVAGATTTLTRPAITTTVANSWVVGLWTYIDPNAAPTATLTLPADNTGDGTTFTGFAAAPNLGVYGSHLTTPGAAGTYASETGTVARSTNARVVYALAIAPATTTVTGSASFSGDGALGAAGSPTVQGTAGFTGAGSLAGSGQPAFAGSASVSGAGSLSAQAGGVITSGADFSGSGTLTAAGGAFRQICRGALHQRWMPVIPPVNMLFNVSWAILRINGEWVETEFPSEAQINAADIYIPGGHEYPVDAATAAILTAAGYTVDTTPLG